MGTGTMEVVSEMVVGEWGSGVRFGGEGTQAVGMVWSSSTTDVVSLSDGMVCADMTSSLNETSIENQTSNSYTEYTTKK
jgi:hypothetical protein